MARVVFLSVLFAFLSFVVNSQSATTSSSAASSLATAVSTDGHCGGSSNEQCLGSQWGDCCSASGFCGGKNSSSTAEYCGVGCQSAFGNCWNNLTSISVDGSCGGGAGKSCLGSTFGDCCSSKGFCGGNETYCGAGCKSSFGYCGDTASGSASATGAAASSTASLAATHHSSVTDSAGFKAGMAVMAIVLAAIIALLAFFIIRRRKRQRTTATAPSHAPPGTAAELGDGAQGRSSTPKAELANTKVLPAEMSGQSKFAELPANENGMTEKDRVARVDDRAANGYDGAYRGN